MALLAVPAMAREKASCGPTVTVKRGDTLSLIARRCGTTMQALLKANPQIRNPNIVPLGSELATGSQSVAEEEEPEIETTGSIAVEPTEVRPGERITLTASGLPPRVRVWIKGGGSASPKHHLVLRGARTNAEGELRTTLRLPRLSSSALKNYRLSIEVPVTGATLLSSPFEPRQKRSAEKSR